MEPTHSVYEDKPQLPHSKIGIAGFITVLLSCFFLLILAGLLAYTTFTHTAGNNVIKSLEWGSLAVWCLLTPFGLILGFVGLFQTNRKRTFAISAVSLALATSCIVLVVIPLFTLLVIAFFLFALLGSR